MQDREETLIRKIAAVIPFGFPKDTPGENASEDLDPRLHVDGWRE